MIDDTIIHIGVAFGLAFLGLLTLWFVMIHLRRRTWYWCRHCGRWQDTLGEYGIPQAGERDGGDQTCEICRRGGRA